MSDFIYKLPERVSKGARGGACLRGADVDWLVSPFVSRC